MDRREFLKGAAVAGLYLKIGPGFGGAAEPAAPDLAAITGESPAAITKAAVDALGGMKTVRRPRRQGHHQAEHRLGPDAGDGGLHESGGRPDARRDVPRRPGPSRWS